MAINLRKMYSVTPANIRKNSLAAVTQVRTRGRLKKYARLGDVYEVIYKVKCTKEWRNVTLRFMKKSPNDPMPTPSLTAPVWVRCTCPWFLYHCEYALSRHGSTWVHYSNGEPANQTNPQNIPFVCKHIYAVQSQIKAFKIDEAPFREPKRKVLPTNVLKNTLETTKTRQDIFDKLTTPVKPTPADPELTDEQQSVRDEVHEDIEQAQNPEMTREQEKTRQEAIDNIEELQDAVDSVAEEAPAETSVVERVKKTLTRILDKVEESAEPVATQAVDTVKSLVRDVKNRGQKALSDSAIVRKLDTLIKRFRGF